MLKCNEISDPNSCLNKAHDNEMLFVLIQRDAAMATTIRYWVSMRIALGKNVAVDRQIQEALACADYCDNTIERASCND